MINAQITAIGAYVPQTVIPNSWFESSMETSDDWIVSRTGIKERRFAQKEEFTSDLAVKAAEKLLAQVSPNLIDIDFIIVATTTADQVMPNTASQVQHKLGIPHAGCIDIMAACAGFVYGIILAKGLIAAGTHRKVLVIGAETLSKFTDYTDRASCVLFGDGAGAVLVEPSGSAKLLKGITGTDGSYGKELYLSQHQTRIGGEEIIPDGKIHQNGRAVYKWAVQQMPLKVKELLRINQMTLEELDWIILHSANLRIIEAIAETLQCPMAKMLTSMALFGNTSSASIPLSWDLAARSGKLKKGDKALLLGFGGGLTFAGIIIEI